MYFIEVVGTKGKAGKPSKPLSHGRSYIALVVVLLLAKRFGCRKTIPFVLLEWAKVSREAVVFWWRC